MANLAIGVCRDRLVEPSLIHSHDFMELVVIESGYGIQLVEDIHIPIRAGDVFVIHPSQSHAYIEKQDLTLTNIIYFDDNSIPLLTDLKQSPAYQAMFSLEPLIGEGSARLNLGYTELQRIGKLVDSLQKSLLLEEGHSATIATLDFLSLLNELCRYYENSAPNHGRALIDLSKIIAYIDCNLGENRSVEELSKMANMSLRTFQRRFQDILGVSPVQYILEKRLEKACQLLKDSNIQISEVSYEVGFQTTTYFSRAFKKSTGLSPKQYQMQHK
jgi:AraC-like DNA-binding protein